MTFRPMKRQIWQIAILRMSHTPNSKGHCPLEIHPPQSNLLTPFHWHGSQIKTSGWTVAYNWTQDVNPKEISCRLQLCGMANWLKLSVHPWSRGEIFLFIDGGAPCPSFKVRLTHEAKDLWQRALAIPATSSLQCHDPQKSWLAVILWTPRGLGEQMAICVTIMDTSSTFWSV